MGSSSCDPLLPFRLQIGFPGRTRVARIFPNPSSCLRLVRALAAEIHEDWIEGTHCQSMEVLREHRKEQLRLTEAVA